MNAVAGANKSQGQWGLIHFEVEFRKLYMTWTIFSQQTINSRLLKPVRNTIILFLTGFKIHEWSPILFFS